MSLIAKLDWISESSFFEQGKLKGKTKSYVFSRFSPDYFWILSRLFLRVRVDLFSEFDLSCLWILS